ncbi:uncharacterized protein LOC105423547 [Pogonomyrmex barbatus]|uniref:Uncharacterized protein LOC105423547 n=1 Tax=Pogonomyrmex barbatus TaxID=144034 RepID=A0A6I9VUD4_9HYME|nr:uncharacterized protein LOC105423547 [Pogonomyrmex barbatus]
MNVRESRYDTKKKREVSYVLINTYNGALLSANLWKVLIRQDHEDTAKERQEMSFSLREIVTCSHCKHYGAELINDEMCSYRPIEELTNSPLRNVTVYPSLNVTDYFLRKYYTPNPHNFVKKRNPRFPHFSIPPKQFLEDMHIPSLQRKCV